LMIRTKDSEKSTMFLMPPQELPNLKVSNNLGKTKHGQSLTTLCTRLSALKLTKQTVLV
jgi:hypothetical protein